MYNVDKTFCGSGECGWLRETKIYMVPEQNGGIGVCLFIGERNLQVGMPPALSS